MELFVFLHLDVNLLADVICRLGQMFMVAVPISAIKTKSGMAWKRKSAVSLSNLLPLNQSSLLFL
jgi:hypothetical protein